jgi:hypothetical protein
MNKRRLWSRVLCVAGIVVSVVGGRSFWIGLCRDSLSEFCLLSGSGLVALSAFLGKSRYRTFAYGVLGLVVISVSAWIAYCLWFRTYLPEIYWLGLMASLTGAVLVLFESPSASMPAVGDISISTRRRWWSAQVSVSGLIVMPIVILMFLGSLWVVGSAPGLFFILFYTFILAGSGLPALGAFLGKSRHRTLLYVAYVLTVCGMIAALLLVFYDESRAPWSAIFFFAYPLGLIMSCVGAVYVIIESFRRPPVPKDNVEAT